jgi:hypothetical protein
MPWTSSRAADDWDRVRASLEAVGPDPADVNFDAFLKCGISVEAPEIDARIAAWLTDHLNEATLDAACALLTGVWTPGGTRQVSSHAVLQITSIRESFGIDALYSQAQALARVRDDRIAPIEQDAIRSWGSWVLSITSEPHLVELVTRFLR